MTAAAVSISESNTGSETITASITNTNMGSTDAVNLDPVVYPIAAGSNSYEKYQRFNLTALNSSSAIKNLKVWRSSSPALPTNDAHKTNARESGYVQKTFATPVATTSTQATQTMPTTTPSGANLGIGGSLTGSLSSPGYSDYLVHQIQVDAGTTAGITVNMNYQYDEIA